MVNIFKKVSLWSFILSIFVTPFVFFPWSGLPIDTVKIIVLYIGIGLSCTTWLLGSLFEKKISLSRSLYFLPALGLVIAGLISTIFSKAIFTSLIGFGFEPLSFFTLLALAMLVLMASVHVSSFKRIKSAVLFFLFSGWLLSLAEFVFIIIGPGAWTLNITNIKYLAFVGSWSSFIVYLGFLFILGIFSLELFKLNKFMRYSTVVFLILQGILIVLGNLFAVNLALLIVAIVWLIGIIQSNKNRSEEVVEKELTVPCTITSFLAVFFVLSLIFPNLLGNFIEKIGMSYSEVRPSFSATMGAEIRSIKSGSVFGSGPARFNVLWGKNLPPSIVSTQFATTQFDFGSSALTTIIGMLGILGALVILGFLLCLLLPLVSLLRKKHSSGDSVEHTHKSLIVLTSVYLWIILALYVPSSVIVILAFASFGVLIWICSYKKPAIVMIDGGSSMVRALSKVFGLILALVATIFVIYSICLLVGVLLTTRAITLINKEGATQNVENILLSAQKLLRNDLAYGNLEHFYALRLGTISRDTTTPQEQLAAQFKDAFQRAEGWAVKAVQYDSTKSGNWERLGSLYQSVVPFKVTGAYEGSKTAYESLKPLLPFSPAPDVLIARLELVSGNVDAARAAVNNALSKKPNALDVIIFRSNFEAQDGKTNAAVEWAKKAADLAPNNPTAIYQLAFMQYQNGSYQNALDTLKPFNALNPKPIEVSSLLVAIYEKSGSTEKAVAELEVLQKIYPENKEIKDKLNQLKNPISNPKETPRTP